MYGETFEVSDEVMGKDFVIPLGKAKIMKEGKHVTIVTFARGVAKALKAAETLAKDGIEAEVTHSF